MLSIFRFQPFFNPMKGVEDYKRDYLKELKIPSIPYMFEHYQAILESLPETARVNLHYHIYELFEPLKADKSRTFKEISCIPLDIDNTDYSKLEDYLAVIEDVTKTSRFDCGVVKSGHGIHYVIQLDTPIKSETDFQSAKTGYNILCKEISRRIKDLRIPGSCDSNIWRKEGTLRFPGSVNAPLGKHHSKQFPQVKGEVLFNSLKPQSMDLVASVVEPPSSENIDKDTLSTFPSPDTPAILEGCQFLKWVQEFPQEVQEPAWYAALTITARLDDGRALSHRISQGHPGYNYGETELKIDQALNSAGPRTCANIDMLSSQCQSCKHYKSISSPILIKGKDYIRTKDTGFWNIVLDKMGNPKASTPNYEDLRRYFEQKVGKYLAVESGDLFIWKGTHWETYSNLWLEHFIQSNMDPKPMNSHVKEFLALCKRTNPKDMDWFTRSTSRKINLKNGVLDLESMELSSHSKKYGFTYTMDYEYDPEAKSPVFDEFIKNVTLDRRELENVLLEFCGYAFSGMEYTHHKVMLLTGEGANGKSTFLNVMQKLAGEKSYSSLLLNQLGTESYRIQLMNKLFNVAEETPKRGLEDSSAFKILSSGGTIMARELYHNPVNFKNRAKFFFACNELPKSSDLTDGLFRRFIIVPFNNVFKGSNADKYIEKKLEAELSGILNRVIEGYRRLERQGDFSESEIINKSLEEFKLSNDTLGWWAEDCLERVGGEEAYVVAGECYEHYQNWCDRKRVDRRDRLNFITFGRQMSKNYGVSVKVKKIGKKSFRAYVGYTFTKDLGPTFSQEEPRGGGYDHESMEPRFV